MNGIRFDLRPTKTYPPDLGVGIWIDGESLRDLIRRIEGPWWAERSVPQPECQYVWVPARNALLPSRHLLGEPEDPWCSEFSVVLVCNCGESACRSIAVRVEVLEDRVTWIDWREFPPDESRFTGLLCPLVFDRKEYLDELGRVSKEYRRTTCSSGPGPLEDLSV
jgi:hypothetical protein